MNHLQRCTARSSAALTLLMAIVLTVSTVEATPLAIDPTLVGTWRLATSARTPITLFSWTINADGTYHLRTIAPDGPTDETGQIRTDHRTWSVRSDDGRVDAGKFNSADQDTLVVTGNSGASVWLRESDKAANAPAPPHGGAGTFDSRLVGTWRAQQGTNEKGQPIISERTIEVDGRYEAATTGQGAVVTETGRFTAAAGNWTQAVDNGGENHGIYRVLDPNTVTIRGKFGWTNAWYRANKATPSALATEASKETPGNLTPPAGTGSAPAAADASATAQPLPQPPTQVPPPTPSLFPTAVPIITWKGPPDEAPIGRWTTSKMGCIATYTFKSDGTSFFNVDAPAFKDAYPTGITSKYVLRRGSPFSELDLSGIDPAHPMSVKAIFLRISKDKFKVEGDMDAPRPTAFTADADVFELAGDAPPAVTPVPPGEQWTGPADEMPAGRFGADQNGTAMYYTFKSDGTMLMQWDEPNFSLACPFGLAFKVTLQKGSPICEMDLESLNPTKPLSLKAIYQRLSKNQFKYQDFGNAELPAAFAANAQVFVHVADVPADNQTAGVVPPTAPAAAPQAPIPKN